MDSSRYPYDHVSFVHRDIAHPRQGEGRIRDRRRGQGALQRYAEKNQSKGKGKGKGKGKFAGKGKGHLFVLLPKLALFTVMNLGVHSKNVLS